MHRATILVLVAFVAAAYAVGQYYVPRSYYFIDSDGHASLPVPLRRLKRSLMPLPYSYGGSSSSANANAQAISNGYGESSAQANARAESGSGVWSPGAGWMQPADVYENHGDY